MVSSAFGSAEAKGTTKRTAISATAQINTQRLFGQSHPFMSLKILLGKFVAFFAGQIPVEGHKNIIDSFQKLIVSSKRFICAHGGPTVLGQIGRRILGRRALRADIHHSLKSPWGSCVWITLPASS